MSGRFETLLFTAQPRIAAAAIGAGFDAVVVDLECRGKEGRQKGADTEINRFTADDVAACRAATAGRLVCRINAVGEWSAAEIAEVLDAGADELLVPMVRAPAQIEIVLGMVDGRVPVGALIETVEAVEVAADIASMGLSRIYLGLNDLAIARRTPNIFSALVDGTAERVAEAVVGAGVSFGLAGLTLPDRGHPVPCSLLIAEMDRLGCAHGFMRRSFLRDVAPASFERAITAIRGAVDAASSRTPQQVAKDRGLLAKAVIEWVITPERANA